MKKDNEYFSIFFIFTGVVHILLLTTSFMFSEKTKPEQFYELKIKLGVDKIVLQEPELPIVNTQAPSIEDEIPNEFEDIEDTKLPSLAEGLNDSDDELIDLSDLKVYEVDDVTTDIIEISDEDKRNERPEEEQDELAREVKEQPKKIKRVVENASTEVIMPEISNSHPFVEPRPYENRQIGEVGSRAGNSIDPQSGNIVTYEQMLPLWLKKFKIYPEQAELLRLSGRGIVRVTIKRNGKVLKAEIEETTGHPILDSALLSMVQRADPVIPVPHDHLPEMDVLTYKMSFGFSPNR